MVQTLRDVRCPQFWVVARQDQVQPGDESELAVKGGGQECTVIRYENQVHGWVNRGDVSKPEVLEDVEKALTSMCDFLMTNVIAK